MESVRHTSLVWVTLCIYSRIRFHYNSTKIQFMHNIWRDCVAFNMSREKKEHPLLGTPEGRKQLLSDICGIDKKPAASWDRIQAAAPWSLPWNSSRDTYASGHHSCPPVGASTNHSIASATFVGWHSNIQWHSKLSSGSSVLRSKVTSASTLKRFVRLCWTTRWSA